MMLDAPGRRFPRCPVFFMFWGRITPLGNVQAEGVCDMITMS